MATIVVFNCGDKLISAKNGMKILKRNLISSVTQCVYWLTNNQPNGFNN